MDLELQLSDFGTCLWCCPWCWSIILFPLWLKVLLLNPSLPSCCQRMTWLLLLISIREWAAVMWTWMDTHTHSIGIQGIYF